MPYQLPGWLSNASKSNNQNPYNSSGVGYPTSPDNSTPNGYNNNNNQQQQYQKQNDQYNNQQQQGQQNGYQGQRDPYDSPQKPRQYDQQRQNSFTQNLAQKFGFGGYSQGKSPSKGRDQNDGCLHPEAQQYIERTHAMLRQSADEQITYSLDYRKKQLKGLKRMMTECEKEIAEALHQDLGKGEMESWLTEIALVVQECDHMLKHLTKWLKPKSVSHNLLNFPGKSQIYRDPLGVVLIISPWNYPVNLLLVPLVGAIAAGNTVMLKPSELARATSECMARLIPKYLDPNCYAVIQGGISETQAVLELQFDLIFYTGSSSVGKKVMTAAAKHLTPVVLELGGKSPTIVTQHANIELAARRIMWGKFTNAGQTCVAPDYLLVERKVMDKFLAECKKCLHKFYGDDIEQSPDYGRIINSNHFRRLQKVLNHGQDDEEEQYQRNGNGNRNGNGYQQRQQQQQRSQQDQPRVFFGGRTDERSRYIEPTILTHVRPEHTVMESEIFGPILPILVIDHIDQAIAYINSRDKPLAMYIFTSKSAEAEKIMAQTSAGGVIVNDTLLHLTNTNLPFGGVGASGMNAYHGEKSIDAFTHQKSVLKRPSSKITDVPFRYPPYSKSKRNMVQRVLKMDAMKG